MKERNSRNNSAAMGQSPGAPGRDMHDNLIHISELV